MAETQTAKQQFDELGGGEEMDALEQLRFFCSLAMKNQDWIDVEPFFDAVKANMKETPSRSQLSDTLKVHIPL